MIVFWARSFARDTRGATALEYGLIIAVVVLALVVALQTFGVNFAALWDTVGAAFSGETSG